MTRPRSNSFVGLRPFQGPKQDMERYLRVDVAKAFGDLFGFLSKVRLAETYLVAGEDAYADFSASGAEEDVAGLSLDAGVWDIFGTVVFNRNGATGTLEGHAWIGLRSVSSEGTTLGLDRAEQQIATVNVAVTVDVMRRVTLSKRTNVYLGAYSVYTGGPIQRRGFIRAFGRV